MSKEFIAVIVGAVVVVLLLAFSAVQLGKQAELNACMHSSQKSVTKVGNDIQCSYIKTVVS